MMNETVEQKEIRMFNFYKKDLEKLANNYFASLQHFSV